MVKDKGLEKPRFAWDKDFLSQPSLKLDVVLKLVSGSTGLGVYLQQQGRVLNAEKLCPPLPFSLLPAGAPGLGTRVSWRMK